MSYHGSAFALNGPRDWAASLPRTLLNNHSSVTSNSFSCPERDALAALDQAIEALVHTLSTPNAHLAFSRLSRMSRKATAKSKKTSHSKRRSIHTIQLLEDRLADQIRENQRMSAQIDILNSLCCPTTPFDFVTTSVPCMETETEILQTRSRLDELQSTIRDTQMELDALAQEKADMEYDEVREMRRVARLDREIKARSAEMLGVEEGRDSGLREGIERGWREGWQRGLEMRSARSSKTNISLLTHCTSVPSRGTRRLAASTITQPYFSPSASTHLPSPRRRVSRDSELDYGLGLSHLRSSDVRLIPGHSDSDLWGVPLITVIPPSTNPSTNTSKREISDASPQQMHTPSSRARKISPMSTPASDHQIWSDAVSPYRDGRYPHLPSRGPMPIVSNLHHSHDFGLLSPAATTTSSRRN